VRNICLRKICVSQNRDTVSLYVAQAPLAKAIGVIGDVIPDARFAIGSPSSLLLLRPSASSNSTSLLSPFLPGVWRRGPAAGAVIRAKFPAEVRVPSELRFGPGKGRHGKRNFAERNFAERTQFTPNEGQPGFDANRRCQSLIRTVGLKNKCRLD
jgi:hypothetical protein